ncbi:TlpA family protein disulfide reductase [Roseateles violae]|uniref:TlpA disulfide reductase family protein n=1 Tax=Roseateles violae TaxID=3058042 RepID=A0ABT8DSU1_9BURK|nr:TlpA disulfide reductase family protein [Pelomonas sp. PFR6]MDN3921048.1 TlpA disulfide reductase family protein [Pelomonas sp. PFR6]
MSDQDSSSRRRWLIGAAGVAAAGLGAGLAWRQQQGRQAPLAASPPGAETFWSSRFEKPEGGELRAADLRGEPLLLNFWATWCTPCVKELPELARFQQEFRSAGWQVLGLAVDTPEPVREFLRKLPLDFPTALAGLTGTSLARTLGNAQGGLPFSVAFDRSGAQIWQKLGPTELPELRELAARVG